MDKISSIVPNSQRVAAVDLGSAQPVRPGTPSFGRPVGASTGGARDVSTTAERAIAEQTRLNDKRAEHMSQVVEEMNNRFFMQKMIPATAKPIDEIDLRPPRPGPAAPLKAEGEFESAESEQAPAEYVPLGSYIDISA